MKKVLNEREINELMKSLNEEQRAFIEEHVRQSKRSKWLELLASRKGIVLMENMVLKDAEKAIQDWVLLDILDGGYGNRPYTCECGACLRFQYIVHHTEKDITLKLGRTCFESYISLAPEVLRDIRNGFYHIDLIRDEILMKVHRGEYFDLSPYMELELPKDILGQYMLDLPLTEGQIHRVKALYVQYQEEECERARKDQFQQKLLGFDSWQREWMIKHLKQEEQEEIFDKLEKEKSEYSIGYLKLAGVDGLLMEQLELGLPLTSKQEVQLHAQLRRFIREQQPMPAEQEEVGMLFGKRITYDELVKQYSEQLKQLQRQQYTMTSRLGREWNDLQQMLAALQENKGFSYKSFYLKLNNLLNALGLYE